jgi:hypothetical protein
MKSFPGFCEMNLKRTTDLIAARWVFPKRDIVMNAAIARLLPTASASLGDVDPWLRRHRLHGVSPEIATGRDDRLIPSSSMMRNAAFGRLFCCTALNRLRP